MMEREAVNWRVTDDGSLSDISETEHKMTTDTQEQLIMFSQSYRFTVPCILKYYFDGQPGINGIQ